MDGFTLQKGSVWVFRPHSLRARDWLVRNLFDERQLIVECRLGPNIMRAMAADQFAVVSHDVRHRGNQKQ